MFSHDPPSETVLKNKLPGEFGVWVFVLGDMLVFAVLFICYAWYRSQSPALYAHSQLQLDQAAGVINTLLLLTGSLLVVLSVHLARRSLYRRIPLLLTMAIASGLVFIINKGFEYGHKIDQGYTLLTNEFYMFFYMLTGIHLLHVCVGTGVLVFLLIKSLSGQYVDKDVSAMESGGAIWHMVDLLWIVLFALLYLIK